MKTCFLIVNYNDFMNTSNLVNNIKNYKCIDEILIVDNNSSEEEKEKLKKLDVNIIYSTENKGYSSAINIGSKYLINKYKECYIIISNADIIIDNENDIKKLIATFDQNTAVVSPLIEQNGSFNKGWKMPSVMDEILMNIPYIHRFIKRKLENKLEYKVNKVDVISGCFFVIKSKVLEAIDYLDENVFLYYEENILSKKIKKINEDILINSDVIVVHNHSVTIDKNIKKINKYKILKKSQYYFNKNYNDANIIELFLLKLTYYITLVILYIYYKVLDLKH